MLLLITPATGALRLARRTLGGYGATLWGLIAFATVTFGATTTGRLERGVIALPTNSGVYIGWRLLAEDSEGVGFEVYRATQADGPWTKVTHAPVTGSTNFVDADGASLNFYSVAPEGGARSPAVAVGMQAEIGGFVSFPLQGNGGAAKAGFGDFDGDGRLDYLLRTPDLNIDPFYRVSPDGTEGYWKRSPQTMKLEAYRDDGTLLWKRDLGWAIETGTWYAPIVVFDVDGDGKAEVYCKGGPAGDPRDEHGRVTSGAEYLWKLDGMTGEVLAQADWPDRSGFTSRKGNSDIPPYNQYSRNIMAIAWLDGRRPHLVVQRGKYTQIKLRAFDPELKPVWSLDINERNAPTFMGAGMHGMQVADIDDDGRDELIIGAAAIDDNGKPLWSTQRGHPDACYVGDLDPARPGLEIYYHHEWPQRRDGVCMVDARTGETLWGYEGPTSHVHNMGLVADIDPTRPGLEAYGGESNGSQFFLFDARGNRIGNRSLGGLAPRAAYWDATASKVIISENLLFKLKPPPPGVRFDQEGEGATVADVVRGMRAGREVERKRFALWDGYVGERFGRLDGQVLAIADLFGDWREEIVICTKGELRIYSTTILATTRRVSLLQDRKYKSSVAVSAMGYFFGPIEGRPIP